MPNLTSLVVLVDIDETVHIPPPEMEQSIVTVDMEPLPIGASSGPIIFSLPCSPTPSSSTETPTTAVDASGMASLGTIEDVPSTRMEDDHICFLINEMRKVIADDDHAPKTLRELDQRIMACKGSKKALFIQMCLDMNKLVVKYVHIIITEEYHIQHYDTLFGGVKTNKF